jgi:nucleotide-binding universal stress UspA family protein
MSISEQSNSVDLTGTLVLIAVDASDQAEFAFNYYVSHLHVEGYQILLVHAAEPPILPVGNDELSRENWDQMMDREHERIRALEDKYGAMMAAHKLSGRIVAVFSNKPGETICKVALRENVSMVVMGTRGLGLVRRTLLGSVSQFVLHHAHCPVCICRPI